MAAGALSAASIAASWDHSSIKLEALQKAAAECEAFPKQAEWGVTVVKRARAVLSVREAQLKCSWTDSKSWAALMTALDAGERALTAEDLSALDEMSGTRRVQRRVRRHRSRCA
jgi:hypothetical protein